MKSRLLIVLPAYNEALVLEESVRRVRATATASLPDYDVVVLIADNASTDGTSEIGRRLDSTAAGVEYMRIEKRGKGHAIAEAWSSRDTDIYVFMDADLSTDLGALPTLVRAVRDGAGLAVGSRYHSKSHVKRSLFRRLLSVGYRWIIGLLLGTKTSDLPCGFKAASRGVVKTVMPTVVNRTWFFDSELTVRTELSGLRVVEVPVIWKEARPAGRRSKVKILLVVREYLREIWRLRRETARRPADASELLETRLACVAALALMTASSIAPLYVLFGGIPEGYSWTGRSAFAPADLAVYLSYIAQASRGNFLLVNEAGAEGSLAIINPVWSLGGLLARIFGWSPLVAYHALRLLLIPPLVWTVFASLRHFVIDRSARIVSLPLLLFGSGVGMYFTSLLARNFPPSSSIDWPTDLWVAESNVFTSALYSPHFIASWILLVASLTLLSMAFNDRSYGRATAAGTTAAVLVWIHPFLALSLATVAVSWWLLWVARRRFSWNDVGMLATFLVLQVPSFGYYALLLLEPANREAMHDVNLLWSPPWPYVAIGFAGFLLLAPVGYVLARRAGGATAWRSQELAIWAVMNLAVIYIPIALQRRLIEGLQFPLAALSGIAIAAIFKTDLLSHFIWKGIRPGVVGTALLLLFLPSSFLASVQDTVRLIEHDQEALYTNSEDVMLEKLRTSLERDGVVLSSVRTGNDVLGWAERPTYAAHWAQTTGLPRKIAEIDSFYGTMDSEERLAFVRAHDIVHVVYGPREQAIGNGLSTDTAFELIYADGVQSIYAPRP